MCVCLPISSLYRCFFLKWCLQPQPRSSILSHPVVNNCNCYNPYRKMKSFAELYEHKCQNSCYPCEDWNGQKWCNWIWSVRSILHLPVLHAFYSLSDGQVKILDIQANKTGNLTLLYPCKKCLLDNNHFQNSLRKQDWCAAMPRSGDSPHSRGLSDLQWPSVLQINANTWDSAPWSHTHTHTRSLPAAAAGQSQPSCRGAGPAEGAQAHAAGINSAFSHTARPSRTAQLTLPTHGQHRQLAQRKPRKKAKRSTSFSICQMRRNKNAPNKIKCYPGGNTKHFVSIWM